MFLRCVRCTMTSFYSVSMNECFGYCMLLRCCCFHYQLRLRPQLFLEYIMLWHFGKTGCLDKVSVFIACFVRLLRSIFGTLY